MRVGLEWLAEYCDPGLDVRELATRLAMTGTEVDRIHHHGVGNLDAFVVGRVLSAEPHPDADRLTICRVQISESAETQIVCGAPNVAAGQTVAIARPGAIMPDGTKLKKAKLRGVSSDGMILAEDELAISSAHDETIVLADGLQAGSPLEASCRSRPRCSSSRSRRTGPTAWASTASRARCTPRPARISRRRHGPRISGRSQAMSAWRSSSRRPTCARASRRARSRT